MNARPDFVDRASRAVYYGGDSEREIDAFARCWHGLEPEAFTRALESGTPEEKAIALFALSYSNHPNAQAMLYTALESVEPMEQWVSALCLGDKERRAGLACVALLF